MKTVTVKIREDDYEAMIRHFDLDKPGRPMVAVYDVVDQESIDDIADEFFEEAQEWQT